MAQASRPPEHVTRDPRTTRVEVVTLVTSAGGLGALSVALRELPEDFPAAVVVAQHLGGQGSSLLEILERRIALPLEGARDGGRISAGRVTACPPDRKSTRLNSSHANISYAVFCLKKKKIAIA